MKRKVLIFLLTMLIFMPYLMPQNKVQASEIESAEQTNIQYTYVNPLYQDVISEEELLDETAGGIAVFSDPVYETDEKVIAQQIRDAMINRGETFVVYYASEEAYDKTWFKEWVEMAFEETDDSHGGDYLRWNYGGYKVNTSWTTKNDKYYFKCTFTVTYYTTLEQEEELDQEITSVLNALDIEDDQLSDAQKVSRIYDYLCKNITYDYETLNDTSYKLKYTAYAALINKTAVCQGYATLLYRMLEESDIDCRVVVGTGNGEAHAWNLLQVGNWYYFSDATWDSARTNYGYYLKGSSDFSKHVAESTFLDSYNIAETEYKEEDASNPTVVLNKYSLNLTIGDTEQLVIQNSLDESAEVIWNSKDTSIASVDSEGNVTAEGTGTTWIQIAVGESKTVCKITVTCEHNYGNWTVVREAVYWQNGEEECICSSCGDRKTRSIAFVSGWVRNPVGWWYKNADGSYPYSCWKQMDGEWYYFNASGYRITGWFKDRGIWYYLDPDTGMMVTGKQMIDGAWYYFDENGAMQTGWQRISGIWYYFASNGMMQTGWLKSKQKWYYLDKDTGAMQTGQQCIDQKGYYFNNDGAMQTGWIQNSGIWYYAFSSGELATGWQKIKNLWYYFGNDYEMYEDEWLDSVYYLKAEGDMAVGWYKIGAVWYYFNSSGEKITSQWIGNYYLKADGAMAVSEWVEDGKYYVDENGLWVPEK